jgi:hypothetical protein
LQVGFNPSPREFKIQFSNRKRQICPSRQNVRWLYAISIEHIIGLKFRPSAEAEICRIPMLPNLPVGRATTAPPMSVMNSRRFTHSIASADHEQGLRR